MPCCRVERGFRILSYIELMGRGGNVPRLLVISYFFFPPAGTRNTQSASLISGALQGKLCETLAEPLHNFAALCNLLLVCGYQALRGIRAERERFRPQRTVSVPHFECLLSRACHAGGYGRAIITVSPISVEFRCLRGAKVSSEASLL